MSSSQQMMRESEYEDQKMTNQKETVERLPLESSPYVRYSDLEDYKRQAYGTQGHLDPKQGLGGGSTDAPTLGGGGGGGLSEEQTDANRGKP
uniref:Late embryogenesis abundant protein, LEA-18 n=1 Tax=Nelumbo nucifera TaxID=4432 RepID=A0A822XPZ0_NELNU|nr:TPA_asm: hypothetical protein HUJ06_022622 [Nelumbo nucifera]